MDVREGEDVEFKREMSPGAVKTVIAFVSTGGGRLCIGVDDEGVPVGVDDVDAEMTRVTSCLRDSVKPDILMMISIVSEVIDENDVIAVHVGRGVRRPYYLASKGPRPEGVYIRSSAASVPASDSAIIRMARECDGDAFEARLSMNQDLTFLYAQAEFEKKGLSLGPGEMRTFGMRNSDGGFTNLALLLSDQCPPTKKAAAFSDDGRIVFTERREYEGSILKQLADAYAFLEAHNHYRTEFSGLERIDQYDYPAVALREALVNSVAHREYALSGSTLVSVMPSAAEIVSLGGLPTGIEYEDLSARISMPRNRALANVLFRLELIEAYGTGIGRMRECYEGGGVVSGNDGDGEYVFYCPAKQERTRRKGRRGCGVVAGGGDSRACRWCPNPSGDSSWPRGFPVDGEPVPGRPCGRGPCCDDRVGQGDSVSPAIAPAPDPGIRWAMRAVSAGGRFVTWGGSMRLLLYGVSRRMEATVASGVWLRGGGSHD